MNTQVFEQQVAERIEQERIEAKPKSLREHIAVVLTKMREDGSYRELDERQQRLLAAFEIWQHSSDATTGVFHYRA